MKIKNYIQFNESSGYEFGCVMIDVPVYNWKEITSYIDVDDIYEEAGDDTHGIQENPHVTLLYGLHKEVTSEMIKSVFTNFSDDITIKVYGIDIFENEKYDVVKFNVIPDGSLQYLHDELSKFPNSNQFPDYKPHITIAYVKKGCGKKYIKPDYKYEVKNVNKITYSMPSGEKVYFDYTKINESKENKNKTSKMKIKSYQLFLESLEDDFQDYLQKTEPDDKYNTVFQVQKFVRFLTDKNLQAEFKYRLTDGEDGLELIEEFLDRFNLPEDVDFDFRALLVQKKINEIGEKYDKEGIKVGIDFVDLAVKSSVEVALRYIESEMEQHEALNPSRMIDLLQSVVDYCKEVDEAMSWAYKGKRQFDDKRVEVGNQLIDGLRDLDDGMY